MVINKLHRLLTEKKQSCTELTKAYLADIAAKDRELHSYLLCTGETALQTAARVDEKIARGEAVGLLAGIPMSLKDNISTKNIPTTCASKMLAAYVPPFDATVWKKLQAQQAVLLGKTNLDEFAMGSGCDTSYFGPTRHPLDAGRVPGGSSGGAAASVAAGLTAYAIASDTGGSIRQPAAFCGVVGLKPTYGRVSRYGLIAYASSMDQIGVIATCVEDAALVYDHIAGPDPLDAVCCTEENSPVSPLLNRSVAGLRIGVEETLLQLAEEPVRQAVLAAAKQYEAMGAQVSFVSMPTISAALPAYYIIACAEASSNLARYDGLRYGLSGRGGSVEEAMRNARSEGFGKEVQRRLLLGTYVLSAGYYSQYYKRACAVRQAMRQAFAAQFQTVDLLLTPTTPTTAFLAGEKQGDHMYKEDICTAFVNLAGLPAISVPCGVSEGLPIGLQLIAPPFAEGRLLQAAFQYEQKGGGALWT